MVFRKAVKWIFDGLLKILGSRIRAFWILILLFIFLLVGMLYLYKWTAFAMTNDKNLNYMKMIIQNQSKDIEQLKQDIQKKDAELQAKAEEKARFARQQWIIANRNEAEVRLSDEVKGLVAKYADAYGIKDKRMVECIILHESGGRDEAVGDSGNAKGVAQYHLATFMGHRRQMGLSQDDLRTDTEASIQAMAFSISHGGIGNWTVS
jgi:hypothetical protein